MTTGVKNSDELCWVLRAIKNEKSLTPAGEDVKINFARLINRDSDSPPTDVIAKYMRLLESQGVLRVKRKYIDDPFDAYEPPDANWERATSFEFIIIDQKKFDILCRNNFKQTDVLPHIAPLSKQASDLPIASRRKLQLPEITMSPKEKFNQDVWWILQEIRGDELLTPKGEKVEFCFRVQPKTSAREKANNSYTIPSEDTQKKLLYKLEDLKAIIDLKPVNDVFRNSDAFNPRIYTLSIKQPKFSELEDSFKGGREKELTPPSPHANVFDLEADAVKQKHQLEVRSAPSTLTTANRKKPCVLEKVKEEWDLVSKKDNEMIVTTVSWQKLIQWEGECGVDYNQVKNILQGFQDEGLIESFELYNPAI